MSEDLLQETFVKALLSLSGQHTNMRAWLYLTARNLCFNAVKKENRRIPVEMGGWQAEQGWLDTGAEGVLESLIKKEQNYMLYRAMLRLPPIKREILELQYFGGLPLREIAGLLQISPENARVLSHRAKRELRDFLKEDGYGIS